jgi:phosphocarrier protein FPr
MKRVVLLAPLSGPLVPLDRVPDPVFAQKLVGDGVSIDPVSNTLRAPCDAEVLFVHPAGHAVNLKTDDGLEVLTHVGLDAVTLKGEGFLPHVKAGQHVRAGDPLIDFSPDYVATRARSLLTPLVVTTMERVASLAASHGWVEAGRDVVLEITLHDAEAAAPAQAADGGPELCREVVVRNPAGLHARPAAMLASAAKAFKADIRLHRGDAIANAKSVTSIMALEIALNDCILVMASGADARPALDTLVPLIEAGLGETPEAPAVAPGAATPAPAASRVAATAAETSDPNLLRGGGVSPGIGIGRIYQWRQQDVASTLPVGSPREERDKFERALAEARLQIEQLRDRGARGAESAGIFAAHLELLGDPDLVDVGRELIAGGMGAAGAWTRAFTSLAERLAAARSEMFAARAADVRDVGRRVQRLLAGVRAVAPEYPDGSIIVAQELAPSDTVLLDRSRVRGFCTVAGGRTSHVAILARSLQIPAIAGIPTAALSVPDGTTAILDGSAGTLRLKPGEDELARAGEAQETLAATERAHLAAAREAAVTTDGHRVEVAANLGAVGDAAQAVAFGAEGVGLLRSEFLFMERAEAPTEDEQYEAYAAIADALGPDRPLIVRTLDVGGDKPLSYLPVPREENPFLGVRGIRLSATRPAMLRAQLRAILRAAAHGRVHVMFPMIATLDDWRFAKGLLEEERAALGASPIPAGIMIEVPSAALLAAQFAAEAEFFSIGTNDLTQYTLAIDRGHPTLAKAADSLHPAVLRLIEATVRGARAHGRWVGVCGDLASDPVAVPILIGLGVHELSASAPAVPAVKAAVRARSLDECRALAIRALAAESAEEIRGTVPLTG